MKQSIITAIPFMFSSYSDKALSAQLATFLQHLETTHNTELRDLAWSLSRRSSFNVRIAISGNNVDTLKEKVRARLQSKTEGNSLGIRPSSQHHKILGIFTGQGAQWPTMGLGLLEVSKVAREAFGLMQRSLCELPDGDRPTWSLHNELAKSAEDSNIMQGDYGQVLCVAVQVMLVRVLRSVGVEFDAVVGHSSGEIGAAYAAGYLKARDAIRVAYYRGKYGKLALGREGCSGAMLAVGTSMEDAEELCNLDDFAGRIQIAASNSSASVTLSGDAHAIKEAQFILEDEMKFARALRVDTAYHSYHMVPCAEPYLEAMKACKIEVTVPDPHCRWFSSVLGGKEIKPDVSAVLSGTYWRDNLVQPVLFSHALKKTLSQVGDIGLVLEVGPHASLKGPVNLTFEEKLNRIVPYTALLTRNGIDLECFSESIGAVWSNLLTPSLDFNKVDAMCALSSDDVPQLRKSAPRYSWDHDRKFWMESRQSAVLRLRPNSHHELLGIRIENNGRIYRWRNFIKPSELSWAKGHQVQSQLIFPGAGFSVMAIEAGCCLMPMEEIALIELTDIEIMRAMTFQDENDSVETQCSLTNIIFNGFTVHAEFSCEICLSKDLGFVEASRSRVKLHCGAPTSDSLPDRVSDELPMSEVDIEYFYQTLWDLGYNYTGMFRSVTTLKRTTDSAIGVIHVDSGEDYSTDTLFHPGPLDVAFQTIFGELESSWYSFDFSILIFTGAMGAPGDGRLWTVLVPTKIKRISINPLACQNKSGIGCDLQFDAKVSVSLLDGIVGDVDLFDSSGIHKCVQVEGLQVSPLSPVTENDDKCMFSETIWAIENPDAARGIPEWTLTDEEWEQAFYVERACFFYIKQLHDTVTLEEREKCEWHPSKMLGWAADVVKVVSRGEHPIIKREWMHDTWELLEGPLNEYVRLCIISLTKILM